MRFEKKNGQFDLQSTDPFGHDVSCERRAGDSEPYLQKNDHASN